MRLASSPSKICPRSTGIRWPSISPYYGGPHRGQQPISTITVPGPCNSGRPLRIRAVYRQSSLLRAARCARHTSSTPEAPSKTTSSSSSDNGGDIIRSINPAAAGDGQGTIATITLSNARRLNSLNSRLIHKLTTTLRFLASQPALRCVVIQGAVSADKSPSFSSGADIHEMAAISSYKEARQFISRLHEACQAVRDLPVVTVAQIHGLCLGGALELAASCDFRYATRASKFSMPETKYGIPSVIEARLLANIVGWQRTKEMVYLAKMYSAEEMEKWGLVDTICQDGQELEVKVAEVVNTVASYGPQTMRSQKRLVKLWEESDLLTGVEAGIDAYASMFNDGGSEPAKYMKAFTERKRQTP